MRKKRKLVKIQERKLGKERAWGLCWHGENLIEIDPRQKSKKYLDTLIHELLHYCFPELSETTVSREASRITEGVWRQNYRRISK